MLKKMNLPNKLTMLRILLVPFFVVFLSLPKDITWAYYVALGIYLVAAITDWLDGQISRKKNLITNFGKIMDPLADKLLVSAAFIMLTGLNIIPAYITAIIILRDFFANSIRMFGSDSNVTIPAALSGKIKTFSQMTGIVFALLNLIFNAGPIASFITDSSKMNPVQLFSNVFMTVLIVFASLATIWSLVDYIIKFKKYINVEK